MRAGKVVLDWFHLRLLGPGTCLLEMSARVPADEVFTSPALILDNIRETMDALCLEVGEEPPSTYALEGELYPALLLLWRVQAYLVGYLDPDSRRSIPDAIGAPGHRYSLQAFTLNRGLPLQVRQVVVVEGWTPEPPSDSPPKDRGIRRGGRHNGGRRRDDAIARGAQASPPEGQEDARGPTLPSPPPGDLLRRDGDPRHGTTPPGAPGPDV